MIDLLLKLKSFLSTIFKSKKKFQPFFWKHKKLEEMTEEEWELLCDGCGKCCLYKMESEDGKGMLFTNVACRLLDLKTCECKLYEHRQEIVHDCLKITIEDLKKEPRWLPKTCAYYLLSQGEDLKDWHPLISRSKKTIHKAKMSVRGRAISENDSGALHEHFIDWEDI